ncbi:MAG: acyl--CoA ligase [Oscillospiraceae bacterium]|nr:acyl--CoA ligase [Oscillospiraceae bacterium]
MKKTVVEYVSDWAGLYPEKVAVIAEGKETTYNELYRLVCGYSKYLSKAGLHKGDIAVICASQSLDYAVAYLAIHLSGGVVASLEKSISDEGMLQVAKQLSAKVIVADLDDSKKTYDALYIPRNNIISCADEQNITDDTFSFPKPEDSADILFTTGTTGASKGVELTHKALVATAENLIFGCGYRKDTVLIVPGPLNHANAIRKFFTTMVNGSTIYILNGMTNIKAFFKALDHDGSIACCLPPSFIRVIFSLTGDHIGAYKDKIDFIESATAPLPEPDKQKLCGLLPNTRLYNNYGSSEAASVCMYNYNEYPGLTGCIGKAMPNAKIMIVDENRKEIKSSKENMGYLACAGDINMKGYVNEPLLTKEVLVDGIVYTNDLGYIDDDGFIYIAGRKGDVINVGGLKVAPTEVEEAALSYEGIEDCICIPVEDNITGKALKLLIVMKKDVLFNVKNVRDHMASKLENYKVPRFYEQVDKVERTYNGKLNRKYYLK